MNSTRSYNSPLRDEQLQETRLKILDALRDVIEQHGFEEASLALVAKSAGVSLRTVFRHFPTREDLFAAFWPYINQQIGFTKRPATLDELLDAPPRVFEGFDKNEKVIRSLLASESGRKLRVADTNARKQSMLMCLADVTKDLEPLEALRLRAIVQTLFSASTWQYMTDMTGLTGKSAGETVTWAIEQLINATRAPKKRK